MDLSTPPNTSSAAAAGSAIDEAALVAAARALRDESVSLLVDLVREPSLLGNEPGAQRVIRAAFESLGTRIHEFEIDDAKLREHPGYSPSIISYEGRRNVVGIHTPKGPVTGKSLIFNGHIDVVPIGARELWRHDPFGADIEGDKLYGRGASDMKAGIVAFTMAFKALRNLGYEPAAPLFMQSVVEEECTGNGALACLVEGYTADAAIITEPLGGMMVCQMGVMWFAIDVMGKPVHASVAHTGVGAIDFSIYLFDALKQLEKKWNEPKMRHGYYLKHEHPVNFNLGKINGGEWASSVPTHCRSDIRIGFYPNMPVAKAKAEIERVLAEAYAAHPGRESLTYTILYEGFQSDGCEMDPNQPVMQTLAATYRDVVGQELEHLSFTGTTDAKFFNLYGNTPATCYGPTGASYHGIDEWVSIDSMVEVTSVLTVFIARWCGLNRLA